MPLGTKASLSALAAAYHSASASASNSAAPTTPVPSYHGSSSLPYNSQQQQLQQQSPYGVAQPAQEHTLHSAAASGNLVATRSLLKSYSSEPTILAAALAQPLHGVLPLHAAASGGNEHIVALLLSYGADPNALLYRAPVFDPTLPSGSSPASAATGTGAVGAATAEAGPGEEGSTALHFAAAAGHRDVISTLLQNGAKADAKDNRGVTPEMLATANLHNLCAEILRKAAAGPAIVPVMSANPSAVSGGPSASSTQPNYSTSSAANGSSSIRKDRALSSMRKAPPPIEINNNVGPPPLSTPTRNLKNQASIEQIAAGMKATFSGWNRTNSSSSNPFTIANPASFSQKGLGKHSSNPNLKSGSALLAERSAAEMLPAGSRQAINAQSATRKSSKDKIKDRLKEPIKGKDKGKGVAQRQHSASTLVFNARDGQPDQAQLSDDSDGDQSDLGFSVATTPPAPNSQGQFFIANPYEAVPPLPSSDGFLQTGEDTSNARRRPSIPFLAAHPAQAVRAALSGTGIGASSSAQPNEGGMLGTPLGKSRDKWKEQNHGSAGIPSQDSALQSPRGGTLLGLTTPRRSESSPAPAGPGSAVGAPTPALSMPPTPSSASLRAKAAALAAAEQAEIIEELASIGIDSQQQPDVFAKLLQQQSATGIGITPSIQRSASTSTSASFKSDAASRQTEPLRSAAAGVVNGSSVASGSPRMQALLLQASASSGQGSSTAGGPPPSPSRLAQRLVKKRSFPSILRKFGSQTHVAHPSPSLSSTGQTASESGSPSLMPTGTPTSTGSMLPPPTVTPPATSVSRQRSAEFEGKDRIPPPPPPPPPPLPSQAHLRARTSTRSRERVWDTSHQRSRTIAGSSAMEANRSSHSSDAAREAEDEVRELLSEESSIRLGGGAGGSHRPSHREAMSNAGGSGSAFPASASNGSAHSSASSPLMPTFVGLSTMPPSTMASPAMVSRAASTSSLDRESLISASGFSSPRSALYRLGSEHVASPTSFTPAKKDRRPRASSAGSMARSTASLRSTGGVSSREAAQQIFNRAELLLQSPLLTGPVPASGNSAGSKPAESTLLPAEGPAEELSLADQLLIFGEALARERELAAGADTSRSTVVSTGPLAGGAAGRVHSPRRVPVVKPVSSEPKLSSTTFSSSVPVVRTVKASPSNDTLPSVQISDSDSPLPPRFDSLPAVFQGLQTQQPSGPTAMERSRSSSPVRRTTVEDAMMLLGAQTNGRSGSGSAGQERPGSTIATSNQSAIRSRDDDRWLDRFRRTSIDAQSWYSWNRPSSTNRSPETSAPNSIRSKLQGSNLFAAMPTTTRTRSKSSPGQPKPPIRPVHQQPSPQSFRGRFDDACIAIGESPPSSSAGVSSERSSSATPVPPRKSKMRYFRSRADS